MMALAQTKNLPLNYGKWHYAKWWTLGSHIQ
jgi:hypothetical protein